MTLEKFENNILPQLTDGKHLKTKEVYIKLSNKIIKGTIDQLSKERYDWCLYIFSREGSYGLYMRWGAGYGKTWALTKGELE